MDKLKYIFLICVIGSFHSSALCAEEEATFESQAWNCAGEYDLAFPQAFRGQTNVRSMGLSYETGAAYMVRPGGEIIKCPLDIQTDPRNSQYRLNLSGRTIGSLGPQNGVERPVNCSTTINQSDKDAIGNVVMGLGWLRPGRDLEERGGTEGMGLMAYTGQYLPILQKLNACSKIIPQEYEQKWARALAELTFVYTAMGGGFQTGENSAAPDPSSWEGHHDIRNRDDVTPKRSRGGIQGTLE